MVVFEPLDDPLKVLPLPLKIFEKLGISQHPTNRVRLVAYNLYMYLLAVLFIPKLFLGYDTIPQCFRSIAEGMLILNTSITQFLLPFKMDQLEVLLGELKLFSDKVSVTEEYKQILINLNTSIHKFTKHYFILTILIIVAMLVSTSVGALYMYFWQTPEQTVNFPLMMENRLYALDAHHNFLHWFLHQLFVLPAICILLVIYTGKAGIFFGSIRFCSTIFSILVLKINRMHVHISREQYTAELKEIIMLHQLAIRCSKLLKKILMDILLAQFTGCVLIWCFFLYSFMISGINAEGITVAAMLFSFSTETFIFCLLGNELTRQAEQISIAIYDTDWYEQPVEVQKLIIPIIQQSQQRIGITAAKFYYIDFNRYGKSMKTAYSFYLLLKDIF
ncbi:odorant receptor 94a-like [Anopheles maculipalpis]|uniref:odorant receptor 94a-like n=1 Tax=Anopheles maculipalpis TaxID=1496333 RepID=UPI0021598742|nr:odorant receptor 94a-like [Anopheles maculipalpis]